MRVKISEWMATNKESATECGASQQTLRVALAGVAFEYLNRLIELVVHVVLLRFRFLVGGSGPSVVVRVHAVVDGVGDHDIRGNGGVLDGFTTRRIILGNRQDQC